MNVTVFKCDLKGEIISPCSKSFAHRLLVAASLSENESFINLSSLSDDVSATIDALNNLGAEISLYEKNIYKIKPISVKDIPCKINAKESGTTLRFLLPIAAALDRETQFFGEGKLLKRPLEPMLSLLKKHNIEVINENDFIKIKGALKNGNFEISGEISSQFISGLLFALPLLKEESTINIIGKTVSNGYIELTLSILEKFNIKIEKTKKGFYIPANQSYRAPSLSVAEKDWSGAAFFIVAGALCGEITLTGLDMNSLQADKKIIDILKSMGAKINFTDDKIIVEKSQLFAVRADCTNCPDLIPVLSVACACADGISEIKGVSRLRDKESDRLEAIIRMLEAFDIKSELNDDCLKVYGGEPSGAYLNSEPDHRMVMSACILGLIAKGSSTVTNIEAVNKSYPSFFEDLKIIGGKIIE